MFITFAVTFTAVESPGYPADGRNEATVRITISNGVDRSSTNKYVLNAPRSASSLHKSADRGSIRTMQGSITRNPAASAAVAAAVRLLPAPS